VTQRWMLRRPRPEDDRKAAGLGLVAGALVGSVVFYLSRHLLAREWIPSATERKTGKDGGRGASG